MFSLIFIHFILNFSWAPNQTDFWRITWNWRLEKWCWKFSFASQEYIFTFILINLKYIKIENYFQWLWIDASAKWINLNGILVSYKRSLGEHKRLPSKTFNDITSLQTSECLLNILNKWKNTSRCSIISERQTSLRGKCSLLSVSGCPEREIIYGWQTDVLCTAPQRVATHNCFLSQALTAK